MPIEVNNMNLPVSYELSDDYLDDRFKKVKIWVAHTGENLNYSVFTKEALEKMSSTLPYTPIVGYIEKNEDDENDFSDHRRIIRIVNDDVEVEYLGHAYGFISESPNANFEFRDGKEWLVTEGYIWTKFAKAIEILDDANGKKSHSMEIEEMEGFIDSQGRVNVESARFSALCILGEDVLPGMEGSTLETFSVDDFASFKDEIKEMVYEFSKKGDENLDKKDEVVEEVIVEEKEDFKKYSDKKENKDSDKTKTDETDDKTKDDKVFTEKDDEKEVDDKDKEDEKKDFQLVFEMSHDDIRRSLYSAIKVDDNNVYNWIIEVFDNHFVYQNENWKSDKVETKFYDVEYTANDDSVSIGKKVEVFSKFLTAEEVKKVDSDRVRLAELETELSDLKQFKLQKENDDKMEILETYSEKLSEEDYKEFSEKIETYSDKVELEKEIAYTLFKKADSENKEYENRVSSFSFKDKNAGKYGEYERLFQ